MSDTGEITCRSYRFGKVDVTVFPELVTIAVPFDNPSHDDYCDASMFVERYTHGATATVVEDDDARVELRMYPNTENLVSGKPCQLPGPDPRIGHWDEPSRRPNDAGAITLPGRSPVDSRRRPLMARIAESMPLTDWYLQDVTVRTLAAAFTLVP